MSSSSDEEDIILLNWYLRRKRRVTRKWLHPYLERNFQNRLFVAARELQESDSKFLAFYRMSKDSYTALVELVAPAIQYRNTNMRECVSAEERILITLRYLTTGCTFVSLGLYFCRGETTVGKIVSETTRIIWHALKDTYMPCPTTNQWKCIAQRFQTIWNIPNCIGAIDGKHVRIEKLPNTGSTNFNYKSFHSIVLLACCDAEGIFTMIETGYAGRNSDGEIFRASVMKNMLSNSQLGIPPSTKLPLDYNNDCVFPHYFVGDEAFPLSQNLMRPYCKRILDNKKRIFNYRLSRVRKTIECAFGMMTEKFQVLSTAIRSRDENKVNDIIKCVCLLHNFVRKREGCQYIPQEIERQINVVVSTNHYHVTPSPELKITNASTANAIRDYLANYFLTPEAALPWQWNYCV